ncbi:hypothetical protein ACFXO7_38045, partial [Nocardia tengchongensis]|uniref:hypothetical protein n=1 Tax=Nocardia tengchongensis TaxID=2055889 RepID=UPI0036776DE3
MRLRANPVVVAGVIGVGMPVLAAGVIAGLTVDDGGSGPDSRHAAASAKPTTAAATTTPDAKRVATT